LITSLYISPYLASLYSLFILSISISLPHSLLISSTFPLISLSLFFLSISILFISSLILTSTAYLSTLSTSIYLIFPSHYSFSFPQSSFISFTLLSICPTYSSHTVFCKLISFSKLLLKN
jgi:hypothetical protein